MPPPRYMCSTNSGLRFGEQAIALGYLNETQLSDLLTEQVGSKPGVGGLLHDLGYVKKGVLNQNRRDFMRSLETMLT